MTGAVDVACWCDKRLEMSEGGWLALGRSCGSKDSTAGDSGILGGWGGEAFCNFSMVGQDPGEGIMSEGYRFRLLPEPNESSGDVDLVLTSWKLIEGVSSLSCIEPSSDTSYSSSKSLERPSLLGKEESDDVSDGTGDVDWTDLGASRRRGLPRIPPSFSSSLHAPSSCSPL